MKKLFLMSFSLLVALSSFAAKKDKKKKEKEAYQFTVVKENPITSIKNQASSGTCWSFSAIGFLESELIKNGKGEHDLSEMYIVRRNYADKAQKFVRLSGQLNFAQGGAFTDVISTLDQYGLMPNAEMTGLNYGDTLHRHGEVEAVLSGYLDGVIANKNKKLSTAWYKGFTGILDAYFGEIPETFEYEGQRFNPQSFASWLGLSSKDYVSITSFTHHPFYSKFAIEVPDNWRWAESYNVPLDEMMQIIDNAIDNGYTIAWGTDVSEIGFSRNGLGVMPDLESEENIGSDQARWLGLRQTEKDDEIKKKIEQGPVKELIVTQEIRQMAYDNYETTDDHGMQIYGIAKDQNGTKYYMVKNSWGETGKYKGIWYVSETFVRYKTVNFFVNKKAIPENIADKLKI